MKVINGETYQDERALYGSEDLRLMGCNFAGEHDGESPLKECDNVMAQGCYFELRYAFWHNSDAFASNCTFTDKARAPFWYDHGVKITGSEIKAVKALRESYDIMIANSEISSEEFGWKCRHVQMLKTNLVSSYAFFDSEDLNLVGCTVDSKYAFQYLKKGDIKASAIKTKDAFWHSENVTVFDTTIDGEYLGWYSKNLRLVRCKIISHQPFCYCQGLILEDCTMEGCDLAFEYSDVQATITGAIASIKNPLSGSIRAGSIGETLLTPDSKHDCHCGITDESKNQAEGKENVPASDGFESNDKKLS
jgi:hypothetical protein